MNWIEFKKSKIYFLLPGISWLGFGVGSFIFSDKNLADFIFMTVYLIVGLFLSIYYYKKQQKFIREEKLK